MACQVAGIQITYKSRGVAINGIWAMPGDSSALMRETLGTRTREANQKFKIPAQPNFPPASGIMEDDTITDDLGTEWSIRKDDDGDPYNAVYELTGYNGIPKQSGQLGQ